MGKVWSEVLLLKQPRGCPRHSRPARSSGSICKTPTTCRCTDRLCLLHLWRGQEFIAHEIFSLNSIRVFSYDSGFSTARLASDAWQLVQSMCTIESQSSVRGREKKKPGPRTGPFRSLLPLTACTQRHAEGLAQGATGPKSGGGTRCWVAAS